MSRVENAFFRTRKRWCEGMKGKTRKETAIFSGVVVKRELFSVEYQQTHFFAAVWFLCLCLLFVFFRGGSTCLSHRPEMFVMQNLHIVKLCSDSLCTWNKQAGKL